VRLDARSIDLIRQVVCTEAGSDTRVRLFGSRVDELAKGGDVDLLLEMTQAPPNAARLAAAVAGRVSRALHGRRVDVRSTRRACGDCRSMRWRCDKGSCCEAAAGA
jgi:predicted nucleotidyltransferase